jgi:hypothetical protein
MRREKAVISGGVWRMEKSLNAGRSSAVTIVRTRGRRNRRAEGAEGYGGRTLQYSLWYKIWSDPGSTRSSKRLGISRRDK